MSLGSGLWSKMRAALAHLLPNHGLPGEVFDVRQDLAATFTPLIAVTVEEYLPTPATTNSIMLATATSTSAATYSGAALSGAVGGGALSPPRNITVTTAGATATHAPATVTINGLDAQGRQLSETITGVNGGAATYSGVKCFAKVLNITAPAATGVDATIAVGNGAVIGLSQTPKIRSAQALPLVRREVYDGGVVTNGVLTLPATNPPFGAYTPNTAPAALAAATVAGTADITAGALYGVSATLDGLTVIINSNGAGAQTLTLAGAGNSASEAALLAALAAKWPDLTFAQGGSGGNKLVITDTKQGAQFNFIIGSGTANTALGLTAATNTGTGHRYTYEYEYDATLQPDA